MSFADGIGKSGPAAFVDGQVSVLKAATIRTMAGNETWDNTYRQVQVLDPAAARDILLPPEQVGLWFFIVNNANAAETITVKEDSDTTTIGSVAEDQGGLFICVDDAGTPTWKKVGIFSMVNP